MYGNRTTNERASVLVELNYENIHGGTSADERISTSEYEDEIMDERILDVKLEHMFNDLKEKKSQFPALRVAINTMLSAYSQIKTVTALESALMCFGRN